MKTLSYQAIEKTPYTRLVITKQCPEHNHVFFEFNICIDGEVHNVINGKEYIITKGTIMLLRPQDSHYFYCNDSHTSRDIYVRPETLKGICDCLDGGLYARLIKNPLELHFSASDYDLKQLENKTNLFNIVSDNDNFSLKATHLNLITEILSLWQKGNNFTPSKANCPLWLNTLVYNISSHDMVIKNVHEIAETTNYSYSYVYKKFLEYMGITLKDYVSEAKFSYSVALIRDNQANISQIAFKLGYNSASNFIIAFKKKFGITPSQLRKNPSLISKIKAPLLYKFPRTDKIAEEEQEQFKQKIKK